MNLLPISKPAAGHNTHGLATPVVAAAELLRRRQGRRSFRAFIEYINGDYVFDPFHALLADTLQGVADGEIDRLMLFCPPQHGKSASASQLFPAYYLGRNPDHPIILTSFEANLAHTFSRTTRDIVEGDAYDALFGGKAGSKAPVKTRQDSRAVDHWQLAPPYRGQYRAAGVGGGISGRGGMLGIIDDPVGNMDQARSLTYRDRVWDWYNTTFRSRIWKGGRIILIMTRWHEDDLAGRLLGTQSGHWTVLRLPALAESQAERDDANRRIGLPAGLPDPLGRAADEPLAPSRFDRATLVQMRDEYQRSAIGSYTWAALYQGSPRANKGGMFDRPHFPIIDALPSDADIKARVRYWDKAGTSHGTGARTAGVKLALAKDGRIYIEHAIAGYYSAAEREKVIRQTAEMDGRKVRIYIEQEPGSGGLESAQATIRNLAGFATFADRPSGDKDTRLEPFAAQAQAGNVYLLRGEWNMDYIEEMIAIPSGARRDQGDATSGAYNMATKRAQTFTPRFIEASSARKVGA